MSVFADTSALYALMVRTELQHEAVRGTFAKLVQGRRLIWTTSFVIAETVALLQQRVGVAAVRDFDEQLLPIVRVRWVDEALYRLGTERLSREDHRGVSLVDCVSFEFMKAEGLTTAFAADRHFSDAGFRLLA